MLPLILAALACGPPDELMHVTNPVEGAVLDAPWTPILVRLPSAFVGGSVELAVDGEDVTDPLGFVRKRYRHLGDDADYVGFLDLEAIPDGEHELTVTARKPGADSGQSLTTQFVVQRPECELVVHTIDGAGAPLDARLAVFGPDGRAFDIALSPDPLRSRDSGVSSVFTRNGTGSWHLPCRDYTLHAVRNPLFEVATADVSLESGSTEVTLALAPGVDDDRFSADLHVHTGRSPDASVPDQVRWHSILAAGLDIVVVTDHDLVTDPSTAMALLGQGSQTLALPGTEAQLRPAKGDDNGLTPGHMNALPLAPGTELPLEKPDHLADYIDWYRAMPQAWAGVDEPLVQLNHPRGIHFAPDREVANSVHALYYRNGLDSQLPLDDPHNSWALEANASGTTLMDWDAVEVINRFSWPLYLRLRTDWFAFMNQGHFITGTGNSDSHAIEVELAGFPINLMPRCDGAADAACLVRRMRAGEVTVTNGPVLTLDIGGVGPGGVVEAGAPIVVRGRVQAASWVRVPEVRVVMNGEVVRREVRSNEQIDRFEDGRLDRTFQWTLQPDADAWVLLEAGWPIEAEVTLESDVGAIYGRVAPGYVPMAFTNPVRIDVDGGNWTPPGL